MSKKRYNKEKETEPKINLPKVELSNETRKSLLAIILLVMALVMFLSFFNFAGVVGGFIQKIFIYLLGWGYYFLPLILIFFAVNFLRQKEKNIYFNNILGGTLLVISVLGLIEIIFKNHGGLIGKIGYGLFLILGFWATLIVLLAGAISACLIVLDIPLRMPHLFKKKTDLDVKELTIVDPLSKEPLLENGKIEELKVNGFDEENILGKRNKIIVEKKPFLKIPRNKNYQYPPLDLLDGDSGRPMPGDIKANANIIKRALQQFGIEVEMGEVNVGPTVTQYTLKPAEGVKLASILALQNDLALALAAHPLRIEAPIPGKALVGIEVPNKAFSIVRLRNLASEDAFQKNEIPLLFSLGRDVTGHSVFANLAKMPHMLIAGATGTGKSVCIHSILSSLLLRNSPDALKMILIDPKRIELSHYNGIPHLLTPVICDYKKVPAALKWAIMEMERRYQLLLEYNVRDLEGYNIKAIAKGEEILPYILIVIDELADLMVQYGKEVEGAIIRLAQMARATGTHIIVSTQRPSVEVITGLIKANVPARIAFAVASQIDSRTILDMAGAEKLLGHGDMLYLPPDNSKPTRLQGAYVSEKEVERLVEFWGKQLDMGENELSQNLEQVMNAKSNPNFINLDENDENGDELYDQAYEVVVKAGKASASLLQRRLRVGYARAARLLDLMEEKNVIGPADGAKPREVYEKFEE